MYERAVKSVYLDPFIRNIERRLATVVAIDHLWKALDEEVGRVARLPAHILPDLVRPQLQRMAGYNRRRLISAFRAALGVDVRPYLVDLTVAVWMEQRITENVALIKTIPPRYHEGLRKRLTEEFTARPFDQQATKKLLRDEYRSSGWNLRRLTRDQTNKTNAGLTTIRHRQLGVERFRWRSVQDARVRPLHVVYDGQFFDYDNPPPVGLPGFPILCRCIAEPIIERGKFAP